MTRPAGAPAAEPSLEPLLELRFAARADRLKLLRGCVRTAARMCGFSDGVAQNIVLAVDEACQNIILHGYRDRAGGEIILGLFRRDDGICVRLRDFAPLVEPAKVRPRDLADLRPGKLGSHFIREIMDSVEFQPAPDGPGNLLEMTKHMDDAT